MIIHPERPCNQEGGAGGMKLEIKIISHDTSAQFPRASRPAYFHLLCDGKYVCDFTASQLPLMEKIVAIFKEKEQGE